MKYLKLFESINILTVEDISDYITDLNDAKFNSIHVDDDLTIAYKLPINSTIHHNEFDKHIQFITSINNISKRWGLEMNLSMGDRDSTLVVNQPLTTNLKNISTFIGGFFCYGGNPKIWCDDYGKFDIKVYSSENKIIRNDYYYFIWINQNLEVELKIRPTYKINKEDVSRFETALLELLNTHNIKCTIRNEYRDKFEYGERGMIGEPVTSNYLFIVTINP